MGNQVLTMRISTIVLLFAFMAMSHAFIDFSAWNDRWEKIKRATSRVWNNYQTMKNYECGRCEGRCVKVAINGAGEGGARRLKVFDSVNPFECKQELEQLCWSVSNGMFGGWNLEWATCYDVDKIEDRNIYFDAELNDGRPTRSSCWKKGLC